MAAALAAVRAAPEVAAPAASAAGAPAAARAEATGPATARATDRGSTAWPARAERGPFTGASAPSRIRRVVFAHKGALQACYEIEAQKDPTLKGGVSVAWTIDASGAVTSAGLAGSSIHNPRVEGCVLRQVKNWHFPSSDGVSQATFPFSFGIGR